MRTILHGHAPNSELNGNKHTKRIDFRKIDVCRKIKWKRELADENTVTESRDCGIDSSMSARFFNWIWIPWNEEASLEYESWLRTISRKITRKNQLWFDSITFYPIWCMTVQFFLPRKHNLRYIHFDWRHLINNTLVLFGDVVLILREREYVEMGVNFTNKHFGNGFASD